MSFNGTAKASTHVGWQSGSTLRHRVVQHPDEDGKVIKGYDRAALSDAWDRYSTGLPGCKDVLEVERRSGPSLRKTRYIRYIRYTAGQRPVFGSG